MKKLIIIPCLLFLFLVLLSDSTFADNSKYSKYPDNSKLTFEDVDSFYESLDKKVFVEYDNAKLNIREKTSFKNINNIKARGDKYGISRTYGEGYHPNRQVYVFITVSKEGDMKTAVFDAQKKQPISYDGPLEKMQ
ncbi:hypothetical protein ACWE42_15485 [Sutcliffiella cohnii]